MSQPYVLKLLIHIFMLHMDMPQYPALQDLINSLENLDNMFNAWVTQDLSDKNELCLTP